MFHIIRQTTIFKQYGKRKTISLLLKCEIVECIGQVMKTLDISQKHKRDHRTIKRFVVDSEHTQVSADLGKMRKDSARLREQLLKSHYKAANKYLKLLLPLKSRKHQGAGSSGGLQLCIHFYWSTPNQYSQLQWVQKYMKINFQTDLITDKCRTALDGPGG